METGNYKVGDRVCHPTQPQWGPGEVLEISGDGKTTVYFALVGQKTMKGSIRLKAVSGPEASHPLLEHRIRHQNRGAKTRVMAELKNVFLRLYPGGFSDPKYFCDERDYKAAAGQLLARKLDSESLNVLLERAEYAEINHRALSVVNATNLIFPNEKMDLKDGLNRSNGGESFAKALTALLYGHGSFQSRFEYFADVLEHVGAAKWTIATYFPFLAERDKHMLLKPVVTQEAALACDFELNYRSELNWNTYESLLQFCECLRAVIADLNPLDMIDLQSFIWCIGNRNLR
jgi:hypothetical protein